MLPIKRFLADILPFLQPLVTEQLTEITTLWGFVRVKQILINSSSNVGT